MQRRKMEEIAGHVIKVHSATVSSLVVDYDGDCFADRDEEENIYDVVRHATTRCFIYVSWSTLYEETSRITLWADKPSRMKQDKIKSERDKY